MRVKTVEIGRMAHFFGRVIKSRGVRGYYDLDRLVGSGFDPGNSWGPGDRVNFSSVPGPNGIQVFSIGYHFVRYGRDVLTARVMPPGKNCSLRVVCNTGFLSSYTVIDRGGHTERDNNVFYREFRDVSNSSSFDELMRGISDLQVRLCPRII